MANSTMTIREAGEDDFDSLIAVGSAALGWRAGEPNTELFRWKHFDNPFGRSWIWVAENRGRIAGYRAFMRWGLVDGAGRIRQCVRAVDTATHPDFQRQGVFSKLTLHGVAEVESVGVDMVFNTPNEQSRPGYLKLGWIEVGTVPVAFRPTSIASGLRMLTARTAAQKWSAAMSAGRPARAVLDENDLDPLLASRHPKSGLATPLSQSFLQWRYGSGPLDYRVWMPEGVLDGVVFYRVRRRGKARECAIGHVLAPGGDVRIERSLLSSLARSVDADYLLRVGGADLRSGFAPGLGQGPRLTARRLTSDPPTNTNAWDLELGDIEAF